MADELIPIKRLEREYYPLRFPSSMRGKRYSAIIFDGCNFSCPFCFEANKNPDGSPREVLGQIEFGKVIDFALGEVKRGNPIEITGGEPTIYPDALSELVFAIKRNGGYVNLATNGSRPEVVWPLREQIDCLGLDIKSCPENIEFYTGRNKYVGFDKPLELLEQSKEYGCDVHFKRIMFDSTRLEDLEFFYPYASHAFWIIKQLRPFPIQPEINLAPLASDKLNAMVREFADRHKDLKGRLVSIADGSGRDYKNYTYW